MRHSWAVSLRALRHRVSCWIRRPLGRLAGSVLLLVLILAGAPVTTLHAHEGGDTHHHHAEFEPGAGDVSIHGADHGGSQAPNSDTLLHAHDVCTSVSAVPTFSALTVVAIVPSTPVAAPSATVPPTAARVPPHRPPIL